MQNLSIAAQYDQKQNSPSSLGSSGSSTIQSIIKVVSEGGRFIKQLQFVDEGFPANFSYPIEDATGSLNFMDASIQFNKYGQFRVVFVIDGIETPGINKITVLPIQPTLVEKILAALDKIVVISVVVFVLMSNSAYHNILWIIGGFGAIILAYIIIIISGGQGILWNVLMFITFALLFIGLLEIVYQLYMRKKNKPSVFVFSARQEMFREYTYQALFHKPSGRWVIFSFN